MKNHYELILNSGRKTSKPVVAAFGNNKSIHIHLTAGGAYIKADSSGAKDADAVLAGDDPLFSDIIRKTLLLYVLRYERHLEIKQAHFLINGISAGSYDSKTAGKPLIYCLHQGRLRLPFGNEWEKESVTNEIATTSRSGYGYLFSALHALLAAKSDHFESERFTFYWMAMNALYTWYYEQNKPDSKNKGRPGEEEKQSLLVRRYGYETTRLDLGQIPKNEKEKRKKRILDKIRAVLKRIPETDIEDFCNACFSNNSENQYVQQILAGLKDDEREYDYSIPVFPLMVFWVPYQIRCASFHAEAALPTYCFEKDRDLQVIRVLNRLLDCFLTKELALWIGKDFMKEGENHV